MPDGNPVINQAYQYFVDEDWTELQGLLHQDVEWHEPSESWTGPAAVMDRLQTLREGFRDVQLLANFQVPTTGEWVTADLTTKAPGRTPPVFLCSDRVRMDGNQIREVWYCVVQVP